MFSILDISHFYIKIYHGSKDARSNGGPLNDHGSNPDRKHEPPREINLSILVNMKGSR